MDIAKTREQFPFLKQSPTPIYLDNAATTQLPESVIDAISNHYRFHNANVGRGNHHLTREATKRYEEARRVVADFIGAKSDKEIIFTSNTTSSINLVTHILSQSQIAKSGDTILLTRMEHHSNLTPWLDLAHNHGLTVEFIPLTDSGDLDLSNLDALLKDNHVSILAFAHGSNVLATVNPVAKVITAVKALSPDVISVVDAAQTVGHLPLDVSAMECDFLSFSAHKMYGPQGVGVLWGRQELLEVTDSPVSGGGSVRDVGWSEYTQSSSPTRFEAGTPNVAGVVGLAKAIEFINSVGFKQIQIHEQELRAHLLAGLTAEPIDGLNIYGLNNNGDDRLALLSIGIEGIDPFDLATLLDDDNIMVRAGNHCTIPLQRDVLHVGTTLRASFGAYNTKEEVDVFCESLKKAIPLLR